MESDTYFDVGTLSIEEKVLQGSQGGLPSRTSDAEWTFLVTFRREYEVSHCARTSFTCSPIPTPQKISVMFLKF